MTNRTYSDAWLKGRLSDDDLRSSGNDNDDNAKIMKLLSVKRAIANFVNILTGDKDIKVVFHSGDQSYTDGNVVTISGKAANTKDFDSIVGLALHEGSHCKLTDFNALKKLINYPEDIIPNRLINLIRKKYDIEYGAAIKFRLKTLVNIIEDRRIDMYIYKTAPGYRGYYNSLYEKYWNSPIIDKALKSSNFRDDDWKSYEFRICNITNKNRDLKALKALNKVWTLLDLANINRLKSTTQVVELAVKIYEEIENCLPDPKKQKEEEEKKEKEEQKEQKENKENNDSNDSNDDCDCDGSCDSGNGDGEDGESNDENTNENKDGKPNQNGAGGSGKTNNSDLDTGEENLDTTPGEGDLTERELEQVEKAMEKQKKFLEGDIKKEEVAKSIVEKVEAVDKADTEVVSTGSDTNVGTVDTIVVKNFNENFIKTDPFRLFRYGAIYQEYVDMGITLGTMLGRKIQVRNDERTTVYNRLKKGKIDGRMIAHCGYNNENVFYQSEVDKYKPALVHITIDGSSSMSGSKWKNIMIAVVAICKAASMVKNLDVTVNYRYTVKYGGGGYKPLVLYAYDSRTDNFAKVKNLFKYMEVNGTTPEGLCYEAIRKVMNMEKKKGVDTYFINFSDGMPGFSCNGCCYSGARAVEHTRKEVNKFRQDGYKILAFLIGEHESNFKIMYGKESKHIDVTALIPLAKELNEMFKSKDN